MSYQSDRIEKLASDMILEGVKPAKIASALVSASLAIIVGLGQGDSFLAMVKISHDHLRPILEKQQELKKKLEGH